MYRHVVALEIETRERVPAEIIEAVIRAGVPGITSITVTGNNQEMKTLTTDSHE